MKRLRITLEGKIYEVMVEVLSESSSDVSAPPAVPYATPPKAAASKSATAASIGAAGFTTLACPMAGRVFKCLIKPGDIVALNQTVIILDAMKMETSIAAPAAGTVHSVMVKEGDSVDEGQPLLQISGGSQ
jgi:biotin carboxyl carrier protein